MKITVACPSYRRPVVETLAYLPFCRVYVDDKEAEVYKNANKGADIVACPKGVQGNLCRVRNYILDREFGAGADVVLIIDDDLQKIQRFEVNDKMGKYSTELSCEDFLPFVEKYSKLCAEFGFFFWGVNCNTDPQSFRNNTPFSTVGYIGGPFQCHLNNPLRYDETLPLKEDYDMILQHLNKYRGALRVNSYHYVCKQAKQKGGCATMRNYVKEKEQFELLQKKWGKRIVKQDSCIRNFRIKKEKVRMDFNPVLHVPIKGV